MHSNGTVSSFQISSSACAQRGPVAVGVHRGGRHGSAEVLPHVDRKHLAVERVRQDRVAVAADQVDGHLLGEHPVGEILVTTPRLSGRRQVDARVPLVDDVGQDVEGGGNEERLGAEDLILVADVNGEREPLVPPEVDPEDLVAGEDVGDHQGDVVDRHAQPLLRVVALQQGRLRTPPVGIHALHRADREVRAGLRERAQHRPPRVRRQDVVGIHERDQVTGAVLDRHVAGPQILPFSCTIRRTCAWRSAYRRAMAAEPSVDPSSTITTSRSLTGWARIESRQAASIDSTL